MSDSRLPHAASPSRRRLIGAAAGAAALAGLPTPARPAGAPIRISHPTPGSAGRIWQPLIQKRGSGGLDLEWVGATPGQGQVQVAAGTVDVAFYGAIGAAHVNARGTDVVIFGPSLNNHGRWIVRGDSPYRHPRDLIGKRIATQAETSETFLQARMAAALHGFDLKQDARIFFGAPAANVALFERGDVDAVIVLEPTATRLVARGARQIARVGDLWREKIGDDTPLVLVGLAAKRSWVEQNRAAAQTLVALFREIYTEVRRQPRILTDLHAAFGIPASEKETLALLPERIVDIYATEWGQPQFDNLERQISSAVELGILPAKPARPFYLGV